jgi:hypothetical protein
MNGAGGGGRRDGGFVPDPNYPGRRGASRLAAPEVTTELQATARGTIPTGPLAPAPTPILYVPGKSPVGGATVSIPAGGAPLNVARYASPDGQARRITVVAYSPTNNGLVIPDAPFKAFLGIAIRISAGGARGGVRVWKGVPSITELAVTDCYVDAQIVTVPFNFGYQTPLSKSFGPVPVGAAANTSGLVTALIYDSPFDEPPGEEITVNQLANSNVPNVSHNSGANAPGPVLVSACSITNTSTNTVCYGIFDGFDTGDSPGLIERAARGFLLVPPSTTAGVGRELLGSFFQGFSVVAITAASAVAGGSYTLDDANGALSLVDVRGIYLDRN